MYSHNAFAQIFNTAIANAGISGAGMASFGTGSYDSNDAFVLGDTTGQSGAGWRAVKTEDRLLAYIAAAATIAGWVLHLMMIGPFLKPSNFPMELLLYTDIIFIVGGLAQIFWALPMIKGWGLRWYYVGIFGTAALSLSLLLTRVPNGITSTALIDTNPMALLTEISQFLYIGVTIIIARRTYLRQAGKMRSIRLNRGD